MGALNLKWGNLSRHVLRSLRASLWFHIITFFFLFFNICFHSSFFWCFFTSVLFIQRLLVVRSHTGCWGDSPFMERAEHLEDEHTQSQNLVPAAFLGWGVRTGELQLQEGLLQEIGLPLEAEVPLLGKSRGRGSLVGCSPWGRWGSDTTERLHFHFLVSCIGEGNGNPLQCSCLENPRDGEARWAAVYGVAQSRTRLKRLSSSSSSSPVLGRV